MKHSTEQSVLPISAARKLTGYSSSKSLVSHPDFPKDVRRFEADYKVISDGLALRFRKELTDALEAIQASPQSAGHFLQTGSLVVPEFRRRNLRPTEFSPRLGVSAVQSPNIVAFCEDFPGARTALSARRLRSGRNSRTPSTLLWLRLRRAVTWR
jgi:hypothetical protein